MSKTNVSSNLLGKITDNENKCIQIAGKITKHVSLYTKHSKL